MNGPYIKRSHRWGDPLPGQGPDKICRNCGGRMHVIGKDSECGSVDDGEAAAVYLPDYDPYEEKDPWKNT